MLHLLCIGQNWQRLTGNVGLLRACDSEDPLVFVREHFDEAPCGFIPVVENPLGTLASSEFHMTANQIANELHVLRIQKRFEVYRFEIAAILSEVSLLVVDVCNATAHAGCEITPAVSEDKDKAIRHVLAAMITDPFNDGCRARITDGKTLASDTVEENFSAGSAVERNVSDDDVLFRSER
jgi:hypothetical protein